MGHWIISAAIALIFSAPQEQVRIILRGGGSVDGAVLGVEHGKYRVQTGDGIREIDIKDVVSVATRPPGPPTPPPPPAPATDQPVPPQDAGSLKDLDDLHARLTGQVSENEAALRTTLTKALSTALADRKAADAAGVLRRIVLWLPETDALSAFKRISDAIDSESAARPADAFAADLALAFASEVARNPRFTAPQRARAFQLVFTVSDRMRERKLFGAETELLARASEAFPEGRALISDRLTRAHLDFAQTLLDGGDLEGAARESRTVLAAIPTQARARQILEKATPATPPAVDLLVNDEEGAGVHPDVLRYFPHAKGMAYTYRRQDGTQISKLYDAVVKDGDAIKIDYTLEQKSGDNRDRHAFQEFVSGGEVYRDMYGRKELQLKFPARAGDRWTWAIGDAAYARRVTAVNAATRVGSKAYTGCLVVEFVTQVAVAGRTVTVTTLSYYAPGVGLVRMDYLEEPYRKYGLELADFSTARP